MASFAQGNPCAQVFKNCGNVPFSKVPDELGKGKFLIYPEWTGKYHGVFRVSLSVRAVGASAFDRTDKGPFSLAFIWSSQGFKDDDCKSFVDKKEMAAIRIASR